MAIRNGEDMSPAEAALWMVETLLDVVVGLLLVAGASTVLVWVWARSAPIVLIVATVALAVAFGVVQSRHTELSRRIRYASDRTRSTRPPAS
jgi:membrane protein YdbS with pleckstrin-like domain